MNCVLLLWKKKPNALSSRDILQCCYSSVLRYEPPRAGFDEPLDKDLHADLRADIWFVPTVKEGEDEVTAAGVIFFISAIPTARCIGAFFQATLYLIVDLPCHQTRLH